MRRWAAISILLLLLLSTASEARSLHDRQEVWLRAVAGVHYPHPLPHHLFWEGRWDAWAFIACGPTIVIPQTTPIMVFEWLAPHELGHILHLTRNVDWDEYSRVRRIPADHRQYTMELFAEDFRWLFAPMSQYKPYSYYKLGPPAPEMREFFLSVGKQPVIRAPSHCDQGKVP